MCRVSQKKFSCFCAPFRMKDKMEEPLWWVPQRLRTINFLTAAHSRPNSAPLPARLMPLGPEEGEERSRATLRGQEASAFRQMMREFSDGTRVIAEDIVRKEQESRALRLRRQTALARRDSVDTHARFAELSAVEDANRERRRQEAAPYKERLRAVQEYCSPVTEALEVQRRRTQTLWDCASRTLRTESEHRDDLTRQGLAIFQRERESRLAIKRWEFEMEEGRARFVASVSEASVAMGMWHCAGALGIMEEESCAATALRQSWAQSLGHARTCDAQVYDAYLRQCVAEQEEMRRRLELRPAEDPSEARRRLFSSGERRPVTAGWLRTPTSRGSRIASLAHLL